MRLANISAERYKWWAMGALSLGIFAGVLDQGSLNIALPVIASHFGADLPTSQWVVLGYTLTISAALLPASRLSDMLGRKRVYLAGLFLLALGSGLAAVAPNLGLLVLFKVVSGLGAALVWANHMAIITAIFPGKERGLGLGLMSLMVGAGFVAAPIVGGALVTGVGWRAVFLVSMLVIVLALFGGLAIFEERRISPSRAESTRRGFDWGGAVFSSAALVVALLALTNANKMGWSSPLIAGGLAGSVALAAAFVAWELSRRAAMFDLRLFKRKAFSLGVTSRLMLFLGTSSVFFLMPFYLQGALGYTARAAGFMLIPSALVLAIASPIAGRLSDRYGWRTFTAGGMVLTLAGVVILASLNRGSSLAVVVAGLTLLGLGLGVFISPNLSSIFGAVEREKHSATTSLMNLVRNTADAAAVAIAVAVVASTMVSHGYEPRLDVAKQGVEGAADAFIAGMRYAFLGLGACLVVGLVTTLFKTRLLEEPAPAPTPAPTGQAQRR